MPDFCGNDHAILGQAIFVWFAERSYLDSCRTAILWNDLEIATSYALEAFDKACPKGHAKVVRALLVGLVGPNQNAGLKHGLASAVANNRTDVVKVFLEHGLFRLDNILELLGIAVKNECCCLFGVAWSFFFG